MSGSMVGSLQSVPNCFIGDGLIRDSCLATIGGGNHFIEFQTVDQILNNQEAYNFGIKKGQIAMMIHSGSRDVGIAIGTEWKRHAMNAWPAGLKHPDSKIFPIPISKQPKLAKDYLEAEYAAANYGFLNRLLLAEIARIRFNEVFGNVQLKLIADVPHNITLLENNLYVSRKGSCPAHANVPVIIPGSMGSPSYLGIGLGNKHLLTSTSHGAGRSQSRIGMLRKSKEELGLDGVECIALTNERIIEEAPAAYKPIQPVIDCQANAGILEKVVKLKPIMTFKG
jgi:tRNA-splicing ligase RtcB